VRMMWYPHLSAEIRIVIFLAGFFAVTTIVIPLTVITITFGELVPKVFSLRNKEWYASNSPLHMHIFSYVVWPAVWFFESTVSGIMSWGERRWQPQIDGHAKTRPLNFRNCMHALQSHGFHFNRTPRGKNHPKRGKTLSRRFRR